MKRRHLWAVAPVVLSLAIAGSALAAGPGPSGGGRDIGGALGTHFGWSFGRGAAPLGSVVSLSGTTLSVLEFDGTTQSFTVSSTTKYFLDGTATTSSAVVAGLNVVVIAPRQWGGGSGGSSSSPGAVAVYLISPNVLGSVQSVSVGATGDTIAVLNPQGFAFTIQTSSSTVFYANGTSSSTAPTFSAGEIVAALGLVDPTNKDQLDATQVNVVPAHTSHH
jgi:hypothetical protein